MASTAREQQMRDDLTAVLEPLRLVLEDLTVTPAGKRRLVRVLVDRDVSDLLTGSDTGSTVDPISLDEVADATRAVGDRLDETDAMGEQPYTLEVSSPGTDRPLVEPRHFRRNVGRLVVVTGTDGKKTTGRLVSAGTDGFALAQDGEAPAPTTPYGAVAKARVEVEFGSAAARATHDDEES